MLTMFAEVMKDGKWHKVGNVFKSTYEEMDGQLTDRVFDGYNKELESFLLVYGHLFDTNEFDCSEEVKNHKSFCETGFVATLKEILDFNWNLEQYTTGYISEWQYKHLKEDGAEPVNIFRKPIYKNDAIATPFFMDMISKYPFLRTSSKYYVEYQYNKTMIKEQCSFFCDVSIPLLIELIPEGGTTEDVRIVFNV